MSEIRLCPSCGALPCDWTDDPYKPLNSQAILDGCGEPPAIGDRREVNGQTVVWMPDPWAYNGSFFAWCSLAALHRDGIIPPPAAMIEAKLEEKP